jgi:hypothetical protein
MQHGRAGMICPGFDFRIRGTRWGCTAPCKEQAGNREHSFAPVFYTHRLVLGSDQARILLSASSRQTARPLPALMLRSIAARRVCKGFNSSQRCDASRSMRAHSVARLHPSRRAHARLRWRHDLACALLRMRTSMRLSPGHDVKQPVFFVPAARFCARVLHLCFAHPIEGGRSADPPPVPPHVAPGCPRLLQRLSFLLLRPPHATSTILRVH